MLWPAACCSRVCPKCMQPERSEYNREQPKNKIPGYNLIACPGKINERKQIRRYNALRRLCCYAERRKQSPKPVQGIIKAERRPKKNFKAEKEQRAEIQAGDSGKREEGYSGKAQAQV